MKKETKLNYTAPVAEATRSKMMMNVLQTLSGGASFSGWGEGTDETVDPTLARDF